MEIPVDIRNYPYIDVVDIYTKDGTHLSSVAKTPDGKIVWDEGRTPSKDVAFTPIDPPDFEYQWKFWAANRETDWPKCAMDGCRNKSCRRLNSKYCHPHTILMELKPYWEKESG